MPTMCTLMFLAHLQHFLAAVVDRVHGKILLQTEKATITNSALLCNQVSTQLFIFVTPLYMYLLQLFLLIVNYFVSSKLFLLVVNYFCWW